MRMKSKKLMKVWLGTAVLVLCLLMGEKTAQAFESEYSMLCVGGVYLVQDGELLCTKLTKENGTVTYDADTNVLTLENYHLTGTGISCQDMQGIKIVLKGTNSITTNGSGIHAYQDGNVTICGGGTLNITAGSWESGNGACGIAMQGADLYIENCKININSSYTPIAAAYNLTIENSEIKAVRTGEADINDPNQNNNIYNQRWGFPGVAVGNLVVKNSMLDITGINYGINVSKSAALGENLQVTDEAGTDLHLIKIHWPYWWMNDEKENFNYAYSASTQEDLYYFDELPNRVLIKPKQTVPEETGNPGGSGEGSNSSNGQTDHTGENNAGETNNNGNNTGDNSTNNSGKKQVTKKINQSYYRGIPASGKVTYVKPASKNITKITIPATVTINGYVCKVTAVEKNAFQGCKKLKDVKIGKNIQTIGQRAFYQCTSLKKISIPGNVKNIKKEAFAGCKNLQNVTFQGKKVTSIGKNAFKNTKKKIKISIPKSKYKAYKKLLNGKGLKSPVYKKYSKKGIYYIFRIIRQENKNRIDRMFLS